MEIFTTHDEVKEKFHEDQLMPPHVFNLSGYGELMFDCACGDMHGVNGHDVQHIASVRPVKAMLKCSNNFYTMVRIKGIFKQTAISEYGYDAKLVDDFVKEKGL